jgi:hypothetical protein
MPAEFEAEMKHNLQLIATYGSAEVVDETLLECLHQLKLVVIFSRPAGLFAYLTQAGQRMVQ